MLIYIMADVVWLMTRPIVVINRIQEVLEELNVSVTRYNLYEMKNTITTLSQSVADAGRSYIWQQQ